MSAIKEPMPFAELMPKPEHSYLKGFESGSLRSKVEYLAVKKGIRQADVFHLFPERCDEQIGKIMEDGLVFLPIRRTKRYSSFSHRFYDTDKLDAESMCYGVVAKDLDVAKEFKAAHMEKNTDHVKIGEYLGYPECCSKFFSKVWPGSMDPIYEIAQAGSLAQIKGHRHSKDDTITVLDDDPLLRSHLRYWGFRVISWFPCSHECEESKERAKVWLGLMNEVDEQKTKRIVDVLKQPSIWSLNKAQAFVDHPYFLGLASSYYRPEKVGVKFV